MSLNRLSRDYKEHPLGQREQMPQEDLAYLYLELNWCYTKIARFLGNKTDSAIRRMCNKYCLNKSKEKQQESIENYNLEKYGVKNVAQLKSSQEKMKKTMLQRYGVENIAHSKENQEKKKQTCLKKYGVDNPAKAENVKKKAEQTNLQKYGCRHHCSDENVVEKRNKTMLEKYGYTGTLQSPAIREKFEQTCLEKYGTKNPFKNTEIREKYSQTIKDKYGVDNVAQAEISKQHYQETCLKKYGVNHALKADSVKVKRNCTVRETYGVENVSQNEAIKEKKKQAYLEHYGVENPMQSVEVQRKCDETKTKHGTHNTSKPEDEIYQLLKQKFKEVIRQYSKDERYPFKCDFYIPERDLFIEYQGDKSHGGHPFDINNPLDVEQVEIWKKKSQEIRYDGKKKDKYVAFIHTWTIRDTIKREWGKDINWLEFFTMEDFMEWYNGLK